MRPRSPVGCHAIGPIVLTILEFLAVIGVPVSRAVPQTASTGALIGDVLDPTGRGIPGAAVQAKNQDMAVNRSTVSDDEGRFVFTLLPPGKYQVTVLKDGYSQAQSTLTVSVTESIRLSIPMKIAGLTQSIEVHTNVSEVQTDSAALGRAVSAELVTNLPLVTRNYTQIAVLSPGVTAGVFNAGELGSGGMPLSQISGSRDGIFVHGARSYDNNYELDGVSVNDVQGSAVSSGGIPIPNPDAIAEFKMQTGLYDAAFGRFGGADISLVTKSGGDNLHGAMFEFWRNNVLNANDFFLNETGQPRADLKQNQFGFTVGGPILKDRLFFFGSYQGTRQINGLAAGQARIACTATVATPPSHQ